MSFLKKKKIKDEEFDEELPELESERMPELGDNIPLQVNLTPAMPSFQEPKDEWTRSLEEGKNTAYCFGCKTAWKTTEDRFQKCPYCGRVGMVKVESAMERYRVK